MGIFEEFKPDARQVPTCQEVSAFLDDYLDGSLDEEMLRQFEVHLMKCPLCPKYLEQYRLTVQMVSEAGKTKAPPELVEHTLLFLRENLRSSS